MVKSVKDIAGAVVAAAAAGALKGAVTAVLPPVKEGGRRNRGGEPGELMDRVRLREVLSKGNSGRMTRREFPS